MGEWLWLAAIAGAVWAWMDSLRARERALGYCNTACHRHGLQLLDETVALDRLTLRRAPDGRIRLRRRYRFEFTRDGAHRDSGTVEILGAHLQSVDLPI